MCHQKNASGNSVSGMHKPKLPVKSINVFWTLFRKLFNPWGKRHAQFDKGGRQSKEEAVPPTAWSKEQ